MTFKLLVISYSLLGIKRPLVGTEIFFHNKYTHFHFLLGIKRPLVGTEIIILMCVGILESK